MTDNDITLSVLKALVEADSPLKGINVKISFKHPDQWFYLLDRSELTQHSAEQGTAFMKWLWDRAKIANDKYGIKVAIHRL